jgi:hypothetical protein
VASAVRHDNATRHGVGSTQSWRPAFGGALSVDAFLPNSERKALAAALNTLVASPTFRCRAKRADSVRPAAGAG